MFATVSVSAQKWGLSVIRRSAKISPAASAQLQRSLIQIAAQSRKNFPHFKTPLTPNQAVETSRQLLHNASLQTDMLKAPAIEPLEQNLSRFLFTVSPENEPDKIIGSGFVFATQQNGNAQLWGATSAAVTQQAGENVQITFHPPHQEPISFPAKVLLQSTSGQAALLQLPQTVSQVALPISLNLHAPQENELLIAYGFSKNGALHKVGHSTFFSGTERVVAQGPTLDFPDLLSGGFLIDNRGQAVGIYYTSYPSAKNDYTAELRNKPSNHTPFRAPMVSEIIPAKQLAYLIQEHQTPASTDRIILFNGNRLGKLALDEKITAVYTSYADRPLKKWEPTPLWSLDNLGKFIETQGVQKVRVVIEGKTNGRYAYTLDLSSRAVTKTLLP